MLAVLTFIVVFIGIVLVHEFGHYLLAKIFGVQVLEFAVGFGPAIWRKRGRETTFRINAFPLGGYVKLAGENPYEKGEWEEGKGFYDKPAWQRLLISLAGPLFSILAGYFLFMVIVNVWGVSFSGISQIIPDSPAEEAGLRKGDIILKINGKYVFDPSVISRMIREGKPLKITVLRSGEKLELSVAPRKIPRQLDLFLSSATGVVEGDFVSIEGESDPSPEFLESLLKTRVDVEFSSSRLEGVLESYYHVPERFAIGFVFSGLSPIFRRDAPPFKEGDRIVAVDGMEIDGWLDFIRVSRYVSMKEDEVYVELVGKKVDWWSYGSSDPLRVSIERDGRPVEMTVSKDALSKIMQDPTLFDPEVEPYKPPSLTERLDVAISRCNWILTITWSTLSKGLFRSVARGEVAGPVGIAQAVGTAVKMGLDSVLVLVAVITINLGLFNLLPLPALDGGRIAFAIAEMITGKKLDPRIEAMIHTIGFLLLLGLLIFITFFDIGRLLP